MQRSETNVVIAAITGAICLGGSAILVRLAASSASIAAAGRCGLALPALGAISLLERRKGAAALSRHYRWIARLAGVFLAGDLIVWSHSISAIGAGLATVIPNLQVPIVAVLAWWTLGERPPRSLQLAVPLMLARVVFIADPFAPQALMRRMAVGIGFGIATAAFYAIFILMLRQATRQVGPDRPAPIAAPLYEASLGATVTSFVLIFVLHDTSFGHPWTTFGWLTLLAMSSQVLAWLLITVAMPRLPAALVSSLLLVQPVSALALGIIVLREHPTAWQFAGVALVLLGLLVATRSGTPQSRPQPTHHEDR